MIRVFPIFVVAAMLSTGCSSKLETGYVPRKLGSTTTERKAYYAPPFSPDATPPDAPKGSANEHRAY